MTREAYTLIYSSNGKLIGEFDGDVIGISKKGIKVYNRIGMEGEDGAIYRVTSKKIVPVASWYTRLNDGNYKTTYYLGKHKKTTKEKYKKAIKNYRFRKPQFYYGTKTNIEKYLK